MLRAQNREAHGDWMERRQRKIQHKDQTMNLWTDVGHCNGATGVVLYLCWQSTTPDLPIAVIVQFHDYTGPSVSINNPGSSIATCTPTNIECTPLSFDCP